MQLSVSSSFRAAAFLRELSLFAILFKYLVTKSLGKSDTQLRSLLNVSKVHATSLLVGRKKNR